MYKNIGSQKLTVFAFDSATNLPKTGDASNITAYVDIDDGGVTVLTDTSATEKDSANAKGYYVFDLAQAETNGNKLLFTAKSATSGVVVVCVPAVVYTLPNNFTLTSIDSNGRLDIIKIAGTTQAARDLGTSVLISSGTGAGQLSVTSGVIQADATKINGVATTSVTTINANVGTTQPTNFTGTSSSALVKTDTVDIAGSAVSTSAAQLGVNVVNAAGTAWGSGAITRASFAADTGLQTIRSNTAAGGAATSITLDASASSTNDFYNNCLIVITGNTGVGQARYITDYVGSTKVATVATWVTNPDNASTFSILAGDATIATIAGTADANVVSVAGDTTAADTLSLLFANTRTITVDSSTFTPTTTVFETDQTTDNNNQWLEQILFGLDGANTGVTATVSAYAFSHSKVKLTTLDTLAVAPSNGHRFLVMGRIEQ